MRSSRDVVDSWIDAANRQDVETLLALSDPDIESVGPRASARGHQVLRDWLARAGAALQTRRTFARGSTVVLAQRVVWRAPGSGEVVGEADVASVFLVDGEQVVRYARHDELAVALKEAGLDEWDGVPTLACPRGDAARARRGHLSAIIDRSARRSVAGSSEPGRRAAGGTTPWSA